MHLSVEHQPEVSEATKRSEEKQKEKVEASPEYHAAQPKPQSSLAPPVVNKVESAQVPSITPTSSFPPFLSMNLDSMALTSSSHHPVSSSQQLLFFLQQTMMQQQQYFHQQQLIMQQQFQQKEFLMQQEQKLLQEQQVMHFQQQQNSLHQQQVSLQQQHMQHNLQFYQEQRCMQLSQFQLLFHAFSK